MLENNSFFFCYISYTASNAVSLSYILYFFFNIFKEGRGGKREGKGCADVLGTSISYI